MPGLKGPEVEKLYAEGKAWLEGSTGPGSRVEVHLKESGIGTVFSLGGSPGRLTQSPCSGCARADRRSVG